MARPKHGYEIMQFLQDALGNTWHIGTSQLYALLKKLEEKGWVRSSLETQETRPSKRVFTLTSSGEAAFVDWLRRPTPHVRDLRIEFMAKLFFFHRLRLEGGEELVASQIRVLQTIRDKIRKRWTAEEDAYKNLEFGFKMTTLEAWLGWLSGDAASFAALSRPPPSDPRAKRDSNHESLPAA
jgi:DNA-binding PadR family transcriptional regulator